MVRSFASTDSPLRIAYAPRYRAAFAYRMMLKPMAFSCASGKSGVLLRSIMLATSGVPLKASPTA